MTAYEKRTYYYPNPHKCTYFDFTGSYTSIHQNELIEYDLDDGRHVIVRFETTPEGTKVTQTFDPEMENSRELQQDGWQAILDNFKKHVESSF